jgi:hypothetical protein
MAKVLKFLNSSSRYVIFFGIFVMISLLVQCLVPFASKFGEAVKYAGWMNIFLNQNFHLPMELISEFWAALSAIYVGADRGMFMIDGFKNGMDIKAFDKEKLSHLTEVIILSFVIYAEACGLNLVFDADLALSPLLVSLGSSVLLYVTGNKAIQASQKLTKEDDMNQDGIKDSEQDPEIVLKDLKKLLEDSGRVINESDLDQDGVSDTEQDKAEILDRVKKLILQGDTVVVSTKS